MPRPSLIVTGELFFIERHVFLFDALTQYFDVELCPVPDPLRWTVKGFLTRLIGKLAERGPEERTLRYMRLQKSRDAFLARSRLTERFLRSRKRKPDYIFHIFSMFSPFVAKPWVPYVMWLDYTMSLAHRNYPPWAPFSTDQDLQGWLACERQAYEQAHHVFTTSEIVRSSVIKDYGLASHRVTVVGGAGSFREAYEGPKTFGSMRCLFNGSDFIRKGGDVLFQAWPMVLEVMPNARLITVGNETRAAAPGVVNLGHISSREQMKELFLASDLVIAPARCDPFPTFLLEALNFGVPCIVSDRDAMPEIVRDGLTGIVVRGADAASLAAAVVTLLSDPSRLSLMSEKAQESARLHFNWELVALKITEMLSKNLQTLGGG